MGLAEVAIRERCGLLAYSPLAFGMLSGKYENGARPANARISLFSRFARYTNPQAQAACSRYVALAREHGLDPAQMALAFVTAQPFVTSNIIGATTLGQLESNLASSELTLPDAVLEGIAEIHRSQPNPAPDLVEQTRRDIPCNRHVAPPEASRSASRVGSGSR